MESLRNIKEVIQQEVEVIRKRRERRWNKNRSKSDGSVAKPENRLAEPAADKGKQGCDALVGLALSGGGIRSAATNLGVLQGLSERKILPGIDYLSTVSGGGYIGACLSSLLSNNGSEARGNASGPYAFEDKDQALFATNWEDFPFREDKPLESGAANDNTLGRVQMDHIRTRASYLATRARHFSPTVMRALGSVFASTLMSLVWFVLLITVLTSAYMAVVSYVAPGLKMAPPDNAAVSGSGPKADSAGAFGFTHATWVAGEKPEKKGDSSDLSKDDLKTIAGYAKTPLTKFLAMQSGNRWLISFSVFVLGAVFLYWISNLNYASCMLREKYCFCFLAYLGVLVALLGAVANVPLKIFLVKEMAEGAILVVPPLFAGGALFGGWLRCVAISRSDKRWDIANRSLLHQLTGILVIGLLFTIVWAVLPGFMNIGMGLFNSLLLVIIGTGLRYAATGKNSNPGQKKSALSLSPKYKEWLLGLCTLVFVFLAVVYAGNIIRGSLLDGNWPANDPAAREFWRLVCVTGGAIVALLLLSLVDANKISPHYFYRDRLAEAFLQTATPDNYCLRDDAEMKLEHLHGDENGKCAARGPYLLMNATLNLTASEDLKAFNRKSDIFTFSRLFVGSQRTGYIKTGAYQVDDGTMKLARAMAISGAAVTSVMGMNSSLARSFVCTIFGVRLGYWLPNFKKPEIRETIAEIATIDSEIRKIDGGLSKISKLFFNGPELRSYRLPNLHDKIRKRKKLRRKISNHAMVRLFNEMIGHTTTNEKEIYLSDGGHSGDNLGIIPLLQRRVKMLLVSDSECDPDHAFDSLNSSLRNAYVDEGIQIRISLDGLRKNEGLTRDKFAVGRIIYPDQHKDQENWLVLFKNTMTGDEIAPIVNYKEKSRDFPHESTGDQFFTEEQFESYRALGRFAVFDSFKSRDSWLKACSESSENAAVDCEAAYDFLAGLRGE